MAFSGHPVRVWLDGSFVTHKPWAPPNDADLAFLVPGSLYSRVTSPKALPLWTLADVRAKIGTADVATDKLHTCLGLTEGYAVNADNPLAVERQRRTWAKVKGPDGKIVEGVVKGFVEVRADD